MQEPLGFAPSAPRIEDLDSHHQPDVQENDMIRDTFLILLAFIVLNIVVYMLFGV